MRSPLLHSLIACPLALTMAWSPGVLAASSAGVTADSFSSFKDGKKPRRSRDASSAGDSDRAGRISIDAQALGDAGPVLSERITAVAEGVLTEESVRLTDDPAGPELRIVLRFREAGGYESDYEIVYDGAPVEGGAGSFECQLCTEGELVEKVEALVKQVAPQMVVPKVEGEPDDSSESAPDPEPDDSKGRPPRATEDDRPGKLQAMGKAGIGLLVAGVASLATGAGLAARPNAPFNDDPERATEISTTHPIGWGVLAAGAVFAVSGAVLLGLDRKVARDQRKTRRPKPAARTAVHPWLGSHGAGLGVTGRF